MSMASTPEFQTEPMTRDEAQAFLAAHRLGRLAFSFQDRVDIRPLAYRFREGWLFGRTAPGEKLETLGHNRWVAFQVDEVRGPWDWESVLVQGAFHLFPEEAEGKEEVRLRDVAMAALKEEAPELFTSADPGRHRTLIFGISVQEISGLRGVLEG